MNDRLTWWEALPLLLAGVAQSVIVGQWYYRSIELGDWRLNVAVAVAAGLALDALVVATVMGRRIGRVSGWSFWAALSAFLCSALIAVDMYSDWLASARPLLHVSYPLMVLLESQHLASARRSPAIQALETLPERSSAAQVVEAVSTPTEISTSDPVAPALNGAQFLDDLLAVPSAPASAPLELSAYCCPHCKRPLKSKQAVGAAVKNGYCLGCKADRLAAA
jgi:hypothetical protein